MRRALFVSLAVLLAHNLAVAQPVAPVPGTGSTIDDRAVEQQPPPRDHKVLSAATTAGAYGLLYGWVTLAWYVRTTDSGTFHWHDEGWFGPDTYAGGADKLGHAWGNYAMTRGVSQVLQYGGWNRNWSVGVSGALSLAFFTFSEVKDGYKMEYGFSYGDEICNTLGVGLGMVMELVPELDRRLDFRISYWPSSAYLARLGDDGPFNTPEDYSGQTMLLAYHLASIDALTRPASFMQYLDLTVGYHAVNYKPAPMSGAERTQDLSIGVSLNLQAVFDNVMSPGAPRGFVHFLAEMYQVPYTTLGSSVVHTATPQPAP